MKKILRLSVLSAGVSFNLLANLPVEPPPLSSNRLSEDEIVFRSCPSGTNPCSGFFMDCLSGCAFNGTVIDKPLFSWSRVMLETDIHKANRIDIEAQKNCLDAPKVTNTIKNALSQLASWRSTGSNCPITGNTWRYTYSQFQVSDVSTDACSKLKNELGVLASSCQDWKESAKYTGIIIGSVIGGVVVLGLGIWAAVSYKEGRCLKCW